MASNNQNIEDIYRQEVALFEKLLGCVKSERDSLISLNVEDLWTLMEKKQKIIDDLDDTHGRIRCFREKSDQGHDAPVEDRRFILGLSKKIAALKEEIRVRSGENVSFIRETLGFFNEVMSSLVRGGSDDSYHPTRKSPKGISTFIYHREV